ncbi:SET domain-containing protein [Quillaja saponaria]|uniref:SET domain-containing protein n=1 Tax=Quillaja saponaria TaxID=32244 RepID=A0AAD7PDL9_QUISA|nr:SET domain-containing protein [Quillaja saponaria]
MASPEVNLEQFLQWLQANRVELRGCNIKYSDSNKGFGIFSDKEASDGVLLVVPLDLAITPMRVLQEPLLGPECRAMFEEGEVDDRFLIILFLMVERLRKNSSWKPYLDMLPTTFGNPLWFTDDELLELKGSTLYRATELQKKNLLSLFDDKVKALVKKLLTLDGDSKIEVCFEDFLWANSVFWARALNIPLPRSFVFPEIQEVNESCSINKSCEASPHNENGEKSKSYLESQVQESDNQVKEVASDLVRGDTVWVEGLVPGIDFCNHDLKAAATWEVDGTGLITGVPSSMYLLSEAINSVPFAESKTQLLEAQKAEMRCLLPRSLLDHGFFPLGTQKDVYNSKCKLDQVCNYSWSGQRKTPSYASKLVFPENFLSALRTIAMQEDELFKVSSLLEELVGSGGERQPSNTEVQAAVWEACGDCGALQLLVDLLHMKLMDLEETSGTEDCDNNLLNKALVIEIQEQKKCSKTNVSEEHILMSRNKWSCVVYRRGQKQLTRLFIKEAEHALQLSLSEES